MRTVAIVQARMASTRLKGKVLADVCGEPLIRRMIDRVLRSSVDKVIVAVPEGHGGQWIADELLDYDRSRVRWTTGSHDDVLSRVLKAAKEHEVDTIVELTADCPLLDPAVVDLAVREFQQHTCDFASTTRDARPAGNSEPAYPRGMDVRVFSRSVLEEVDRLTQDPQDREHVSLYIWQHPGRFRCRWVPAPAHLSDDVRLTVDEPADLELVRAIFESLHPTNPEFDLADILALLNERPELREINRHIQQKEVR